MHAVSVPGFLSGPCIWPCCHSFSNHPTTYLTTKVAAPCGTQDVRSASVYLIPLLFCTLFTMALAQLLRALPIAVLTFLTVLSSMVKADGLDQGHLQQPGPGATPYKVGDPIPITCLNRTIDTGEHVEDEKTGQLQYIPFWTCNETGLPLSLSFGVEKDINCTIDMLADETYHLLEFYVHQDAPLTCRIPSRPIPTASLPSSTGAKEIKLDDAALYTPFTISLTGMLQLSHVHIANAINVVMHAAPRRTSPGTIDAATAYSVSPADASRAALTKVIIGDPLPLQFSVRWYPDTRLPPAWRGGGVGGHFYFSTFVYCLISAGVSAVICIAYFRGIDLPRRLKSYGQDKLGMGSFFGRRDGLPLANAGAQPKYNGYGYGVSTGVGNGWGVGTGKRD